MLNRKKMKYNTTIIWRMLIYIEIQTILGSFLCRPPSFASAIELSCVVLSRLKKTFFVLCSYFTFKSEECV